MDSSINVLLTLVRNNEELINLAVKIANGLDSFPNYEYFREPMVVSVWEGLVPELKEGFVIVDLKDITDVYSYVL